MTGSVSPYRVTVERSQAEVRILLGGELDSSSAPEVNAVLFPYIEDFAWVSVLVDLSGVEFIDSSGLQLLVQVYQAARKTGVPFRVRGATPMAARLFEITGLQELFGLERCC